MKPPKPPERFTTDKEILSGSIYLIQQGDIKKVVSKGSLEKMNLSGHWVIIKEFKDEIQ
jgi:hypothetical protein